MKKALFIFLLALTTGAGVFGQQKLKEDQTPIEARQFDNNTIEGYKSDSDFDYGEVAPPVSSFWETFFHYLNKILRATFSDKGAAPYIRYLIVGLVVLLIIYFLLKHQFSGIIIFQDKSKKVRFREMHDDIYSEKLEDLLSQTIWHQHFREAVRILYLIMLRKLSDKELIQWHAEKTNRQYYNEIPDSELLQEFKTLTYTYEHIWYGDFLIDESNFDDIHNSFKQCYKKI